MISKVAKYRELRSAQLGGPSLWRFYKEMLVGDLVIVSGGKPRCLVMRVEGDYQWDSRVPGFRHWRPASLVTEGEAEKLWQRCGARVADGENIRWTLARCGNLTP